MKKLGLIGGSGPESTLVYYKELNRRVSEKLNGEHFPEMIIESIDLFRFLDDMNHERYDDIEKYLLEKIRNMENSGAEIVALTAATLHIVYDRLKEKVAVPFISIPEAAAEYAVEMGYKKVGLLGTIFTMENDYLSKAFVSRGIEVVVPEKDDRILVNERIYKEFEYAIIKEESVAEAISVVEKMKKEKGIEALILGCTELPLALNENNCPVPPLDIMELHIRKLTELILE